MNGAGESLNPKVMGIDSSTLGVAWCVVQDAKPIASGKINLTKIKGMNDKLKQIGRDFPSLLEEHRPDYIFIEKTIFIRSAATARVLSYVVGALMVLALSQDYLVTDIEPMVAKSFYGYTPINKKFTAAATRKLGKLESRKLCAQLRKTQIQRVNKYNFPDFEWTDDDISDACSIAIYGYNERVKPVTLKKTKKISIDYTMLATLGLNELL